MKTMLGMRHAGYVLLSALLSACASSVSTQPAQLAVPTSAEAAHAATRVRVLETTEVVLDTAYKRGIQKDSIWRRVGALPQGEVFRPVGDIFTIEGRQVHEAYLVLNNSLLVGFYLPGESAFSPLSHPPKLSTRKENNE